MNKCPKAGASFFFFLGGQGGGTCHPLLLAVKGAEYLISPHPALFGMGNNHVFQYLFALYDIFYWTYPDHIFSLFLSMYSIHRMRGNRIQSNNDLPKHSRGGGGGGEPPPHTHTHTHIPPSSPSVAYGARSLSH